MTTFVAGPTGSDRSEEGVMGGGGRRLVAAVLVVALVWITGAVLGARDLSGAARGGVPGPVGGRGGRIHRERCLPRRAGRHGGHRRARTLPSKP